MYTGVTQSILEWCDAAIPYLKRYHDEVTDYGRPNAISKKSDEKVTDYYSAIDVSKVTSILSTTTLVIGILKMQTAQFELSESQFRFNNLLLNIIELELKIREIFDSEPAELKDKNREFHRSLEGLLRHVESDIGNVKYELNNEIQAITDMKIIIKNANGLIALDEHSTLRHAFRNQLIKVTRDSLVKCHDYRKNHK